MVCVFSNFMNSDCKATENIGVKPPSICNNPRFSKGNYIPTTSYGEKNLDRRFYVHCAWIEKQLAGKTIPIHVYKYKFYSYNVSDNTLCIPVHVCFKGNNLSWENWITLKKKNFSCFFFSSHDELIFKEEICHKVYTRHPPPPSPGQRKNEKYSK